MLRSEDGSPAYAVATSTFSMGPALAAGPAFARRRRSVATRYAATIWRKNPAKCEETHRTADRPPLFLQLEDSNRPRMGMSAGLE